MPAVLEITLKDHLFDAEGAQVARKAAEYLGIVPDSVRAVHVLTIDAGLSPEELAAVQSGIFQNPVTQVSSFAPLPVPFDWTVWVGLRPGVRDNPGATAVEAIQDLLGKKLAPGSAVYTSRRFCILGSGLTEQDAKRIAGEILANDIIQQWKVLGKKDWDPDKGIGVIVPKVMLARKPQVAAIPIDSDETLTRLSDARNLALDPRDIPVIRGYFLRPEVIEARKAVGLSQPTDVELEYISQGRSDHCNHNTFRGLFRYRDLATGESEEISSLFKTYIEKPTLEIQKQKPWVVSVLWDNAGAARFDEENLYVITGETHNSPSNMEAYGGSLTGIVGVYRDPMGTGLGAKLIAGTYGFCVGPRDWDGDLHPKLHPRRLLDGVIEGVKDGGNKSGVPTPFGTLYFHPGYMGKCLVFVTAVGLMPKTVCGKPSHEKTTSPGELIVMCGGRVGKDGIHGVTASSEVFSEHTPAGHVQIGDPYTQKKMMDFLLEARDLDLIAFITDNGGGGLSSSVGESARGADGALVTLEKVPLKYEGLDQWEIWVSESQERMTVSVRPEHIERFLALAERHAVEATVIGEYTKSGKLHITYEGETCAYVDLSLLSERFPQWEFDCEWLSPDMRGLCEPVLTPPPDFTPVLYDLMASENICSRAWIARQYDHEVQGATVVKPLLGVNRIVPSDAGVLRPVLSSQRGLALSQALCPAYSAIDAYHMTANVIDEALRRVVAVGGDPDETGGVDNFCWPTVRYDAKDNPDGKYKAAQLVRSCKALAETCLAYGVPLLSGKDSMYVDGRIAGRYGERHKVSALPTLQFTTTAAVPDVSSAATLDFKCPGDLVYVLGRTRDELGASQYYELLGHLGKNVPQVACGENMALYRALHRAIKEGLAASVHGVYAGGLAVHLALCAMAGGLGASLDLAKAPADGALTTQAMLFSESAGRFIVTVAPENAAAFEKRLAGNRLACVGKVAEGPDLVLAAGGKTLVSAQLSALHQAFTRRFGKLI
ncbi:MAG: AIR synthase-related protein [Thermodesulfobacteriota bacterium]